MQLAIPALTLSTIAVALLAGCGGSQSKEAKPLNAAIPPPRITMFYTSPGVIETGETSQLCYSVEDTAKVALDPPVDRVWPALTRCIEIKPVKTTKYTFTAENTAGVKVTATTEARVVAANAKIPSVRIIDVSTPPGTIQPGQGFQFCVHAKNAKDWKLSAGQWFNPPDASGGCVVDHPAKTTVYVITAVGAMGESDSTRVTATVK